VPLPRLTFPDAIANAAARLATLLADVIGRPPVWGLAVDHIKTTGNGFVFRGVKAERELGVSYRPIEPALKAAIAALEIEETEQV